jgi:hypothetical protein
MNDAGDRLKRADKILMFGRVHGKFTLYTLAEMSHPQRHCVMQITGGALFSAVLRLGWDKGRRAVSDVVVKSVMN